MPEKEGKYEEAINQIRRIAERLKKAEEKAKEAKTSGNKEKLEEYELARQEYEDQFKKWIKNNKSLMDEVEKRMDELKEQINSLRNEELRYRGMLDIEKDLGGDTGSIEKQLNETKEKLAEAEKEFSFLKRINEEFEPYRPKPFTKCPHIYTREDSVIKGGETVTIKRCIQCGGVVERKT